MAVYTQVFDEDLERFLGGYDLGQILSFKGIAEGVENSNYLLLTEGKDKIIFKVCNSHAKTFSCSDMEGNYYTITGSGNWTINPRIEMYHIFNIKEMYNFNKEWMLELLIGGKKTE